MPRTLWILAGVLLAAFAGVLAYGIYVGDPAFVFENAAGICFT